MRLVEVLRRPSSEQRAELLGFVQEAWDAVGRQPLSDRLWIDLAGGTPDDFVAVRVRESGRTLALAVADAAHHAWLLEAVLATDAPTDVDDVLADAVRTAVDAIRAVGGGSIGWWCDEVTESVAALAAELGLTAGRALHEMRRPLPSGSRAEITTRPFRPGIDDEAWLAVNNRAFADHPEQGAWTLDTLRSRMNEPWFEADGFRLHDIDGRLAGFCWTKVHHDHDAVLGEIYVIAVDPDFHGRGLGRQMTLSGLDWLSDHGIADGMLYVDAGNTAAVSLYEQLGFTIHRTRQVFGGTLAPLDPIERPTHP